MFTPGSEDNCVPCTGGYYCPNQGQIEVDQENRELKQNV